MFNLVLEQPPCIACYLAVLPLTTNSPLPTVLESDLRDKVFRIVYSYHWIA